MYARPSLSVYTSVMSTETRICPVGDHPFEFEIRQGKKPAFCSKQHAWKAAAAKAKARNAALTRRTCARCQEEKDVSNFGGTTNPYCRPCHTEYERERRQVNGQQNPEYTRELNLRRYGLTIAQVDAMLAVQDGRCAICRTDAPGGQGWHVDHDHRCCNTRKTSCGRCTRGLLCSRCNIAIGNLRDDAKIIEAALNYVSSHRIRVDNLMKLPPGPAPATQLPIQYPKNTGARRRGGHAAPEVLITELAPAASGARATATSSLT